MPIDRVLEELATLPADDLARKAVLGYIAARWYESSDQLAAAQTTANRALQAQADLRPAMRLLQRIATEQGDIRQALGYLDQQIRSTRHPREAAALYHERARLVERWFADRQAVLQCNIAALRAAASDIIGTRTLLRNCLHLGDRVATVEIAQRLVDLTQDERYRAGLLHMIGLVSQQGGRYPQAVAALEQALLFAPTSPLLAHDLRRVAIAAGDVPAMAKALALELREKTPESQAAVLWQCLAGMICTGRSDAAFGLAPHALELTSQPLGLLRLIENLSRRSGDLSAVARACARQAVTIHKDARRLRSDAWCRTGVALLRSSLIEPALHALKQAVELDPGHSEARWLLRSATRSTQRPDLYAQTVAVALEQSSVASPALRELTLDAIGWLSELRQTPDIARPLVQRALHLFPHDLQVLDACMHLGELAEDEILGEVLRTDHLRTVLEADEPMRIAAWALLAERLGETDAAVASYQQLCNHPSYRLRALAHLGRIKASHGHVGEALRVTLEEAELTTSPRRKAKLLQRAGELALEGGAPERAIEQLELATSVHPEPWAPREALIRALREHGQPEALAAALAAQLSDTTAPTQAASLKLELLELALSKPELAQLALSSRATDFAATQQQLEVIQQLECWLAQRDKHGDAGGQDAQDPRTYASRLLGRESCGSPVHLLSQVHHSLLLRTVIGAQLSWSLPLGCEPTPLLAVTETISPMARLLARERSVMTRHPGSYDVVCSAIDSAAQLDVSAELTAMVLAQSAASVGDASALEKLLSVLRRSPASAPLADRLEHASDHAVASLMDMRVGLEEAVETTSSATLRAALLIAGILAYSRHGNLEAAWAFAARLGQEDIGPGYLALVRGKVAYDMLRRNQCHGADAEVFEALRDAAAKSSQPQQRAAFAWAAHAACQQLGEGLERDMAQLTLTACLAAPNFEPAWQRLIELVEYLPVLPTGSSVEQEAISAFGARVVNPRNTEHATEHLLPIIDRIFSIEVQDRLYRLAESKLAHRPSIHLHRARRAAKERDFHGAIAHLKTALGLEVEQQRGTKIRVFLAQLHHLVGDTQQAVVVLEAITASATTAAAANLVLKMREHAGDAVEPSRWLRLIARTGDLETRSEAFAKLLATSVESDRLDLLPELMREAAISCPFSGLLLRVLKEHFVDVSKHSAILAILRGQQAHGRMILRNHLRSVDVLNHDISSVVLWMRDSFELCRENDPALIVTAILESWMPSALGAMTCDELHPEPWPLPQAGCDLLFELGSPPFQSGVALVLREAALLVGSAAPDQTYAGEHSVVLPTDRDIVAMVHSLAKILGLPEPIVLADGDLEDGLRVQFRGGHLELHLGRKIAAAPAAARSRDTVARGLWRAVCGGDAFLDALTQGQRCAWVAAASDILLDDAPLEQLTVDFDSDFYEHTRSRLLARGDALLVARERLGTARIQVGAVIQDANRLQNVLVRHEERLALLCAADPRPVLARLARATDEESREVLGELAAFTPSEEHFRLRRLLGYVSEVELDISDLEEMPS